MGRGYARGFRPIFRVPTIDCELYTHLSWRSFGGIIKDMRTTKETWLTIAR